MSDHEFWNELGNLYFMSGAYEPAIHAYARAIASNRKFGRPYSNMALAFTQTGKYVEAIELYHRGIELLADEKEKAVTWNRLGILYRQLKDYHSAVVAYQKADALDPAQDMWREDVSRYNERPITVSMPPINLQDILKEDDLAEEKLVEDANAEFELAEGQLADELPAESKLTLQWFDDDGFVPPDPEVDSIIEAVATPDEWDSSPEFPDMNPGEWKLAPFEDVTPVLDHLVAGDGNLAIDAEVENSQSSVFSIVDSDTDDPAEVLTLEATFELIEEQPSDVAWDALVSQSSDALETPIPAMMDMTEIEALQYSQVEYPLNEPAEFDTLNMDIEKFRDATVNNPRSAIAWEELGDVYKKAGRFRDAIRAYERAINITSNKPSYYYRLGLVFAAERLESEAINAFQKTLELDGNYTLAHASLGSHYRKIGLADLAQKHIDIAMNTALEDENEYNRACLEAICGNTDRALELLQVALQSKQTHVGWALKDPDLDSLREDPRFEILLSAYAASVRNT